MKPETVTPRPEWNTGGGDRDQPYRFGLPISTYLSTRDYARLLVLKARFALRKPSDGGRP